MSFKIGNVVKLKGGGPAMTVTGTSVGPDRPTLFDCTWFDKDNREQQSSYPAEALISAEKRPHKEPVHIARAPKDRSGSDWMR